MSFKSAATTTAIVTHILHQSCTAAANTAYLVHNSNKFRLHRNRRPTRYTRTNSIYAFQLHPGLKGRESKKIYTTYHQAPFVIKQLDISQKNRSVHNLNHPKISALIGSHTKLFSSSPSSTGSSSPSSPSIQMHHFNSVKSTQDEARKILKDKDKHGKMSDLLERQFIDAIPNPTFISAPTVCPIGLNSSII